MKHSTPATSETTVPSLFQLAAHFEDSAPAGRLKKPPPSPSQTPFIDLMTRPDKLEAALKATGAENGILDASRTITGNDGKHPKRNPPTDSFAIKNNKANLPRATRKVELILNAPSANSVKLTADFTEWEKCPLDMMRDEDGMWSRVIPREPGQYSYRFIVDGKWCDDPRSTQRVPNAFGSENAVLVVI